MPQSKQKIFRFKQFQVRNDMSAMKVGTDGVLVGAWTPIDNPGNILDIGAGTGLISLMIAQRAPQANITAIEIDPIAASEAQYNISRSPWADRINLLQADATTIQIPLHSIDLIVSNPPFFTETLQSPDPRRAASRHGDTLNVYTLIDIASKLLTSTGHLSFIAPASETARIREALVMSHLHPTRIVNVHTTSSKPPKRTLWLATPALSTIPVAESLVIGSAEYNHITEPYYL